MDLLQGNNKNEGKTEKTQAQKVILILLIISIILCVIVFYQQELQEMEQQ